MQKIINYGRHDIAPSDIDAVVSVLKSDFLTQGPQVPLFEMAVGAYCKSDYAVAVNSATSALHIACLALGVGDGDIVWTSANTFVASANCALYCGASVDFVDIDEDTFNMSAEKLAFKLEQSEIDGTLPKVIIPVHMCGTSPDMRAIGALAQKYGIKIIEDASHAIGARYLQDPVGACAYSDITVFSFHPVKIITSGEGGMATTNSEELAVKMRRLRTHGITNIPQDMVSQPKDEMWNYQQVELGYNYRMTDIHAALGMEQLKRVDEFISRRHEIANYYEASLANLPITLPQRVAQAYSALHLYVVRLERRNSMAAKDQKTVFHELHQLGINVNLHYIPVYLHPYYHRLGFERGYCIEAERYYSEAVSLPMYSSLSGHQQRVVVKAMNEVLG